jgi:HSP20 family protein
MARSMIPLFGRSLPEQPGPSTDPFLQLHREMNRLFDDLWRGSTMPMAGSSPKAMMAAPRVDVSETEKEVKICAELPGVDEKDVQIELDEDVLTIRGEKKAEEERKDENYHVMERSYGSFARSIRLPFDIDPDQVRASFENGVLTVVLPKQAARQKVRRIEIKPSAGAQAGRGRSTIDRAAAGDKPEAPSGGESPDAKSGG